MAASDTLELLLFSVALLFVTSVTCESIMCVSCNSHDDRNAGDCENNPPEPTRCQEISGIGKYCVIAKEYTLDDALVGFVRSCATNDHGDSSCQDMSNVPGAPAKVCYKTCNTDGCNSAKSLNPLHISVMLVVCIGIGIFSIS